MVPTRLPSYRMLSAQTAAATGLALMLLLIPCLAQRALPQVYPWPQQMTASGHDLTLADAQGVRVRLVLPPAALTPRQQRVLDQVVAQFAGLSGRSLKTGDLLAAPSGRPVITVHLAVAKAAVRQPPGSVLPDRPQAYAIRPQGNDVFVTGRDDDGLVYALLTLRQLLTARDGAVVLPGVTVRDWPDMPWRSLPICRMPSRAFVAWATEVGRCNACFNEPYTMDWSTMKVRAQTADELRPAVSLIHEYGIKVVASSGYHRQWARQEHHRDFCPSQDVPEVLAEYQRAIDAGVDGLAWHFDDLTESEARHHLTCPLCKERFKTLAAWEVYCLQEMLKLGKQHGLSTFWACPSIYSLGAGGDQPKWYLDTAGEPLDRYLHELCGFPGAESVRFYYCEFRTKQMAFLKEQGLRNYIWWNNGPWSADCGEVWGAYLAFARMAYSWDLYDRKAIRDDQTEEFDQAAYADLATLKERTDLCYSGTSDPIGIGLGTHFGWNNAAFVQDEEGLRDYLADQLFGPGGHEAMRTWERHAMPLWVKYQRLEPFTAADRAALPVLEQTLATFRVSKTNYEDGIVGAMDRVVKALTNDVGYADLVKPLEDGKTYASPFFCGKAEGALLAFAPSAAADALKPAAALEAKVVGPVLTQARAAGRLSLMTLKSQVQVADDSLILSGKPFAAEVAFTPTRLGADQYTKLIGTRATFREIYPGNPGWALGYDGASHQLRFTVEDPEKHVSTVATRWVLELNRFFHVVAVRDWPARKLLLYVNGQLAGSADETGSGDCGGFRQIAMGYDAWGGGYVVGAVHRIVLHDRALNADEIAAAAKAAASGP